MDYRISHSDISELSREQLIWRCIEKSLKSSGQISSLVLANFQEVNGRYTQHGSWTPRRKTVDFFNVFSIRGETCRNISEELQTPVRTNGYFFG